MSFLQKVLFFFDIFNNFFRKSTHHQKTAKKSIKNKMYHITRVNMLTLHPLGMDYFLICMLKVILELLEMFKMDFCQKMVKSAYFLSSTFREKLNEKNLPSEDILHINDSIQIISYVNWIVTYFMSFIYSNIQILSKIQYTSLNFVMQKWSFSGVFQTSLAKISTFLRSQPIKTYDFLKIDCIWKPLVAKASACCKHNTLNNFFTKVATFCNQELET